MNCKTKLADNLKHINKTLNINKSFDLISREVAIGGKASSIIFIDGFVKDDIMERMLSMFFSVTEEEMKNIQSPKDFIRKKITYIEVHSRKNLDEAIHEMLAGTTMLLIDGYDEAIILDMRIYPSRDVEEPNKEKVTHGSKDGFVETIVFNTALIRRRIRDSNLIFEMFSVGERTKTDVVIGYLDDKADKKVVEMVSEKIKNMKVEYLSLNIQSLIEGLSSNSYNPFPIVRYTERPDTASSQILEGKVIIIIDNCPSVIILPTSFFDFLEDTEDYYYPPITGTYMRVMRNSVLFGVVFFIPLWLLMSQNTKLLPEAFSIIGVKEMNRVPLIIQFLILEIAMDVLKFASLNTPNSLGASLTIIGGFILSDFAVKVGLLVPETILYMSFVAIGTFTQASTELGYALKFCRVILTILVSTLNFIGFLFGVAIMIGLLLNTKTISGHKYLYPLYPFNWSALKRQLGRKKLR